MNPPSNIRQLLVNVVHREMDNGWLGEKPLADQIVDALLASPLREIIGIAAWCDDGVGEEPRSVRALLADWRANS